ncbi:hypothetical protein PTKIN_Ptkin17bG0037200 [Pterospermum kingtungense]
MEDYNYAKFERRWIILDHYLIVKEWSPNFDFTIDSTERVLVWVRFPCLPIKYYDQEFLMKVSGKIGKPVRVDTPMSVISKGKFARLSIEVDITKPLLAKFKFRRRVRKIEYEGFYLVCFNCGVYSHRHDNCPLLVTADEDGVERERATADVAEEDVLGKGTEINPKIMDNYCPWMLVSREIRGKKARRTWRERQFARF